MNQTIRTHECTYYFSMATGNRNKQIEKRRDFFREPEMVMQNCAGFDIGTRQNLKYRNSLGQLRRRAKRHHISAYDRLIGNVKLLADILSTCNKTQYQTRIDYDLNIKHWNNRRSQDRNNLLATDFAIRDHTDDTDYLISRWCQEFPRLAADHPNRGKAATEKPWGDVHDPIYVEPYLDEN